MRVYRNVILTTFDYALDKLRRRISTFYYLDNRWILLLGTHCLYPRGAKATAERITQRLE